MSVVHPFLDRECEPIWKELSIIAKQPRTEAELRAYRVICRVLVRGVLYTADVLHEDLPTD